MNEASKIALPDSEGFAPIVADQAQVLILGSMPGAASLAKQQYYGHPRNAFWPIMAALFGVCEEWDYPRRKEVLLANGVAVWDVIKRCRRMGSLDANIDGASIEINDFAGFFARYQAIRQVFFNGATAESLYNRHVRSTLPRCLPAVRYQRLPSTSPAHAALGLAEKLAAWQTIKDSMVK